MFRKKKGAGGWRGAEAGFQQVWRQRAAAAVDAAVREAHEREERPVVDASQRRSHT